MTRPAAPDELPDLAQSIDCWLAFMEEQFSSGGAAAPSRPPSVTVSGAAHVWHQLDRRQTAQAWGELTRWVDWLTDRYELSDRLPGCWYRHGALIDELDALRAAWTAAYQSPHAKLSDALNWHASLTNTLSRIRDWDRLGCLAGTHRPPATDPPSNLSDRTTHVFDDVQRRSTPAPPIQAKSQTNSDTDPL